MIEESNFNMFSAEQEKSNSMTLHVKKLANKQLVIDWMKSLNNSVINGRALPTKKQHKFT